MLEGAVYYLSLGISVSGIIVIIIIDYESFSDFHGLLAPPIFNSTFCLNVIFDIGRSRFFAS